MRVALLAEDPGTLAVVGILIERLGVTLDGVRVPARAQRDTDVLAALAGDLHQSYDEVVVVCNRERPVPGALVVTPNPSLEAWLTTDPDATGSVFGAAAAPPAEHARRWLDERVAERHAGRMYSRAIDGVELASRLDLVRLAEAFREFRALAGRLSPVWSTGAPMRRPVGRPPGVALFRGTGYVLCLEILSRGNGAKVRPGDLTGDLGRTKTPVRRFFTECVHRGYLRKGTPKGPFVVRGTSRLVDDLVKDIRGRTASHQLGARGVRSPQPVERLLSRLQDGAAQRGRAFAVTGAAALQDIGGDELAGAPIRAFMTLNGAESLLAQVGAVRDDRDPQLVLTEPYEAGVFHAAREDRPRRVAPWQAVIDLLASDSSRERELGERIRLVLERSP